jgi:cytochrome c553
MNVKKLMMKRIGLAVAIGVILGLALVAGGGRLLAQDTVAPSHAPGFPLWAYGHITPPDPPEDWSERCLGTRPRDCDRPGGMPSDTTGELLSLEGSDLQFTQAQITSPYAPADWFPGDHPEMPDIVAHGREEDGFRACAICHYPNGLGLMQNGPVAGLPVDYFLRQLADMASGARRTTDLHKANGPEMAAMARNLTPEEAQAAAEYYSSLTYTKWITVIESETVPTFTATRNALFLNSDTGETEPLGNRLVEMPADTYQSNRLRNPRSGMVAYAPIGSLARGEEIVRTGGDNSVECLTCHGPELRGTAIAPPIAGRGPSYMGRQLYDMQQGSRNGDMAQLMKPAVERLTEYDIIAIVAYVASLDP